MSVPTGFGVILVMALVVLPVAMIAVGKLVTDNTMLVIESSNIRLVCESSTVLLGVWPQMCYFALPADWLFPSWLTDNIIVRATLLAAVCTPCIYRHG